VNGSLVRTQSRQCDFAEYIPYTHQTGIKQNNAQEERHEIQHNKGLSKISGHKKSNYI